MAPQGNDLHIRDPKVLQAKVSITMITVTCLALIWHFLRGEYTDLRFNISLSDTSFCTDLSPPVPKDRWSLYDTLARFCIDLAHDEITPLLSQFPNRAENVTGVRLLDAAIPYNATMTITMTMITRKRKMSAAQVGIGASSSDQYI